MQHFYEQWRKNGYYQWCDRMQKRLFDSKLQNQGRNDSRKKKFIHLFHFSLDRSHSMGTTTFSLICCEVEWVNM